MGAEIEVASTVKGFTEYRAGMLTSMQIGTDCIVDLGDSGRIRGRLEGVDHGGSLNGATVKLQVNLAAGGTAFPRVDRDASVWVAS